MSSYDADTVRRIALYSVRIIETFLRDIEAGSYPQSAMENPAYCYFNIHYENIIKLSEGKTFQEIIDAKREESNTKTSIE